MPVTGAQVVIDTLISAGITKLFSLSGNQILALYDATIDRDIEIVHVRHEAAAVAMADAWGRVTGRPGVALITAGPGHCNTLAAIYSAKMAESPVVILSGHCPTGQIGTGAFQEIDQVAVAKPVSKAAWLADRPDQLRTDIDRALLLAAEGRPGPIHVSLPVDLLEAPGSVQDDGGLSETPRHPFGNAREALDQLSTASHPLILAGPAMGRGDIWKAISDLSKATGVPALSTESPRGVNDPALHHATNFLALADLVLLVGKKLDSTLKFGDAPYFNAACRFIQIDADEAGPSNGSNVSHYWRADPLEAVTAMLGATAEGAHETTMWLNQVSAAQRQVPPDWRQLSESTERPVHPLALCRALQPWMDDGAVLVSDGGEFGQWAQAAMDAEIRLTNGPGGAIGFALPMGVAARMSLSERPVFVLTGDGAFGFHTMEIDTALRYGAPVIVVVGNDATWNAEHQLQIAKYGPDRTVGCQLLPTRYDLLVASLGGHGEYVEDASQLPGAIQRAVASGLPSCINVCISGAPAPTFRED
ncbi:MAG: thiamine pyrophosphate-binding protein [Candidatus Latescibacteria bacterium]|nr:thiamine pyrophosphate-binding protein [Candidatus Latescibacterota bacterium]